MAHIIIVSRSQKANSIYNKFNYELNSELGIKPGVLDITNCAIDLLLPHNI